MLAPAPPPGGPRATDRRDLARRVLRWQWRIVAAALLASGCAKTIVPPPKPVPVPPRPRPGYEARRDSLDRVDTSRLAGRRIVLDPGHGGFFPGSRGAGGLAEAEVNLDVARTLAALLERHGAQVLLTRGEDRDFLTPADSSLRADLAERTRIANAFAPELFVSVHHNADPGGAHDRNETQTYFKLGDEGPSLDAAQSLHRYLRRNLGIDAQRILPGNYFVLRNSVAPAVLTEASYLSDPDVETRLALPEKRRLEAEALFLGIADYFACARPVIRGLTAHARSGAVPDTAFAEIAAPRLQADVDGAFDDWRLTLDGAPLAGTRTAGHLEWQPPVLAPGRHVAVLEARLATAGAALPRRLEFTLARRPARLRVEMRPAAPLGARAWVPLRIAIEDSLGTPCPDSLPVRLRAEARGVAPAETVVVARDGVAWAYLRVSRAPGARPVRLRLARARATSGPTAVVDLARRPMPRRGRWAGTALEMPSRLPLRDAPGTREPAPGVSWLNRDGFAWTGRESSGTPSAPRLPGYRSWAGSDDTLRLVAVAGGALHRRRLALDPDGGGSDTTGMGPGGTRAAIVNLQVARALAALLEAAGAEVVLVRDRDEAVPEPERVRRSEAFGAERYLRIGRRAETPHLGYFFSSAGGRAWAERTAAVLASLGLPRPALREDAQYPLQQTSCPALYAGLGRIDDPGDEERVHAPGVLRAEAYALYLGLAGEFAPAAAWPVDSLELRDPEGRPASGQYVTLGRSLVLESDALGRIRFARTESGPLEADWEATGTRRALLDSERGCLMTGPHGR